MYPNPFYNNQLKYNMDIDSKPIYFTSVPTAQPKAIIIERIGCDYHLNQNDENNKPSTPMSSLELAIEMARRDVQDEVSKNFIQKLQFADQTNVDSKPRIEMQINKRNKMIISKNNKISNSSNIRSVQGTASPAKDRETYNKMQNNSSIQKFQNGSLANRSLKKLSSEIEQMTKEIYMCITHLLKILTFKLDDSSYLDQYEIERISSRVGDRHIRINRCIYSLNTDLNLIFMHFEKEINLLQKRQIFNLLIQCFRNQLRILRLVVQQVNDWLKFGKLYIQTLNSNINEHLSKLIYIFCHSLDICMHLKIFEDSRHIEDYLNELANNILEDEAINFDTKFVSKFRIQDNTQSKIEIPGIIGEQNVSLNQEVAIKENQDNLKNKFDLNEIPDIILQQTISRGDYFGKNNISRTKPKKKLYGGYRKRKINFQKSKDYLNLNGQTPPAPPPSNRSDLFKSVTTKIVNQDNQFNMVDKNQTINAQQIMESASAQQKQFNYLRQDNLLTDSKSNYEHSNIDGVCKKKLPVNYPQKRIAIENLVQKNQKENKIEDITTYILDKTMDDVVQQQRKEKINDLSYYNARNILINQHHDEPMQKYFYNNSDVDIIARRLREIELEKLDIRQKWKTLQFHEDFSHDISNKTEKPIIYTKTKTKVFPEKLNPKKEPKFQMKNLSPHIIDNILKQREDFKVCINKLNYGNENMDEVYFNPETLLDKISDEIFGECLEEISSEIETIYDQLVGNVFESEIQICE